MRIHVALAILLFGTVSSSLAHMPRFTHDGSFGVFYSSLDSHGEWIWVDRDIYAWRPIQVTNGWRPYTVGRWVWTNDGWYWASEEPWGWATYHYGRWYCDDYYGWMWIPGYEWAPAWVEWRYGGDCVGWAPLGPYAVFNFSFGIHYTTRWVTPGFWWSFVDCRYVASPDIHRYVYRTEDNTRNVGRTRSAGSVRASGGRVVTRGPERNYVERRGNVRIEAVDVLDTDQRRERIVGVGGRDRIEVYRPRLGEPAHESQTERPARVRDGERRIALDVDGMDIHARGRERNTSRDVGRINEYQQKQSDPDGSEARTRTDKQRDAGRSPREGRREYRNDADRDAQQGSEYRRHGDAQPERRNEHDGVRSSSPERSIRRVEPRVPERSGEPARGGGRVRR